MDTGGAVTGEVTGQQLVGCEEAVIHHQVRPVWVRGGVWEWKDVGVRGMRSKGDDDVEDKG